MLLKNRIKRNISEDTEYLSLIGNVLNSNPEGILVKDKNLNILFLNDLFCSHTNFSPAKSFGEYREFFEKIEFEVINKKVQRNFDIKLNGNFINFTIKPLINKDKPAGIAYFTRNITEDKNLTIQKETYVATLCHDLKNPTIGQIKALELLNKGAFGKIEKEQNEIISVILESCKYLKSMLDGFLGTYSTNCGITRLNHSKQSLKELVKECINDILYISSEKDIKINFKFNKNCDFTGIFDKIQIRRVVMNLLINGIKYAHKNTELKISIFEKENSLSFEFENESEYIPEENRKKIFKKYVSYAETIKEKGVGLGLYISKKIIEAHKGEIYLESFLDNRTIFGFSIPKNQKENSLLSF